MKKTNQAQSTQEQSYKGKEQNKYKNNENKTNPTAIITVYYDIFHVIPFIFIAVNNIFFLILSFHFDYY